MIRAFGGRLILTPAELSIGGAVAKAKQLYAKGGYYMPMQFENPDNVRAQEKMALEALEQLDCQVDVYVYLLESAAVVPYKAWPMCCARSTRTAA